MTDALQVDQGDRDRVRSWLRQELNVSEDVLAKLDEFVALLLTAAQEQNLIARATQPTVWSRHILDSAQLLSHVPRETHKSWIDLGSGAGLPGLVIAIIRPESNFTLVERRPLRTAWLERAAEVLGLDNVEVVSAPVSAVADRKFDVITARAFAPMPKLFAMAERFATGTTLWILPKGRSASDELKAIPGWQSGFHVEPSVTDDESGIIVGKFDPAAKRGAKLRPKAG